MKRESQGGVAELRPLVKLDSYLPIFLQTKINRNSWCSGSTATDHIGMMHKKNRRKHRFTCAPAKFPWGP